jgi:hypothetical protein
MKTLNINILDIISLAEDSLRGIFEDKLSAKDSVFQARCKAAAREGKNIFDEPFTTEEEAAEISLLNLALEYAISDKWLTHNQYLEWLQENHLEDSEENYIFFNSVKKTVNEIVDCLRCPSLIEKKTGFGEEAVELLKYITTGGINHKAPAFVIE